MKLTSQAREKKRKIRKNGLVDIIRIRKPGASSHAALPPQGGGHVAALHADPQHGDATRQLALALPRDG